ncbi:chloride channel protein [Methanoculleus chikugoensis]|uniref:chloride channel protein n=1 Tax=Methanoculleus chikugoensis TaxID=118126 RepID=UPI0006D22886|nr:chloride channel protein [Methanoculleus chikugoensis]
MSGRKEPSPFSSATSPPTSATGSGSSRPGPRSGSTSPPWHRRSTGSSATCSLPGCSPPSSRSAETKNAFRFLTWNLLAGTVGYLFYLLLGGLPSFARSIPFEPIGGLYPGYILYAITLGILGSLLAVFAGVAMQTVETIMDRVFGDAVVARVLAAGAVIACAGYFVPEVLFSGGEGQLHGIIADPARLGGVGMLLGVAILKIILLALSFKSGYIGGPLFPIIFSSTLIGLALHLVFPPGIPVGIFVLCIEAAALTLALGAPPDLHPPGRGRRDGRPVHGRPPRDLRRHRHGHRCRR